jgi:hypothetical protein
MMINPSSALAFSLFENKGVYAVLIGSGVSRAAKIPTGWDVTKDLVRRVAAAEGIEEQHDWAAWYREKAGKEGRVPPHGVGAVFLGGLIARSSG